MARQGFQEQLRELRENVLYMSEVVLERMRMGLRALETKDESLAREVIEGDHEINRMYLDLEQDCIDLFALQQPVAGDLRFIAASFKIITDLERVADLATNLAGYAVAAGGGHRAVDVQAVGALTVAMVEDAVDADDADDADACFDIDDLDDEVDAACERAGEGVVRDLITRDAAELTGERMRAVLDDITVTLLTIRDLERVGDHAVNVAARTLYMVENNDALLY